MSKYITNNLLSINDFGSFVLSITDNYLKNIDKSVPLDLTRYDLIRITNEAIDMYNLGPRDDSTSKDDPIKVQYPYQKQGAKRYTNITGLLPLQIAKVAIFYYNVSKIFWDDSNLSGDNFSLGFYEENGYNKGLYITSDEGLETVIREINPMIKYREIKEVLGNFKAYAPKIVRTMDRDLIAVNNGIFDYKNKKLLGFDPSYVYLSKSRVDFNFDAKLTDIVMPDGEIWNVEKWFDSLSDNEDVRSLLWETTSAILRPYVSWNKALLFYSPYGNNGKGTFCALLRNLLGDESHTSISIKAFGRDFMLSPLLSVNAVITDENDVGAFLDQGETFKLAVTQDPIQINIKNKDPKVTIFRGLIVQCLNDLPRFKDKSESMYRRFLPVLFDKRFEGIERKYIKDDYINRKEVLEYVLYKALMGDCYEFTIPKTSDLLLDEMRDINDPVRQFLTETLDKLTWDLIPNDFLYSLYKAWFKENMSGDGKFLSKIKFLKQVREIINNGDKFEYIENALSFTKFCSDPEPLIYEYDLKKWMNDTYKGSDKDMICSPDFNGKYFKGLFRKDAE